MNNASLLKPGEGFSHRLYRLLLYCYPAQFRRAYAHEMMRAFSDSYREAAQRAGKRGVVRLWSLILYDLGSSLCVEHRSAFKTWIKYVFAIEERPGKTLMTMTFAQLSDIGRQRQRNEDSVISFQPEDQQEMASKGVLFVVADGLGGHSSGDLASQLAVNTVRDVYYHQGSDDLASSLRLAMEQANLRIYGENTSQSPQPAQEKMMGTTCVAAVVCDDALYVANVGDSRAYIVRDGQAQQISLDHSLVARQVREGLMTKEQAMEHPDRNKIYRCLGEHAEVEVDSFSEKVQTGDILLLCTDGLTALVTEEEIASAVQQYEPQESVQRLIARANELGGPDNITAVVARVA